MTECTLIPGIAGVLIQGVLLLGSLLVLGGKYALELHKEHARTLRDFLLDGSKQIAGSGWIHVMNLTCAFFMHQIETGDECGWYFLNIVIDCTLGVGIEFIVLGFYTSWVLKFDREFATGSYRDATGALVPRMYAKQLGLWIAVLITMKIVILLLLVVAHDPLRIAADAALVLVSRDPRSRLLIVMIYTPLFMNALQFVVVDCFLKKRHTESSLECRLIE